MLLEFCDAKHLCITYTWFRKADNKKTTYGTGCNKRRLIFDIMGKEYRMFLKNVKVITGELQHNVVIVDIDKKQKQKTEWKSGSKKRNVAKLRDELCRELF